MDLESDEQRELYAHCDGYDRATRTSTDEVGEVDLEQDYATFVQTCRQAPKESCWTKIEARAKKMVGAGRDTTRRVSPAWLIRAGPGIPAQAE